MYWDMYILYNAYASLTLNNTNNVINHQYIYNVGEYVHYIKIDIPTERSLTNPTLDQ
jgi:hypothetical protein